MGLISDRLVSGLVGEDPQPLRIGVMLRGRVVPRWVHTILRGVAASEPLELSLVVFESAAASKRTPERDPLLYRFYERLDRRLFAWPEGDPLDPVDAAAELAGAEHLELDGRRDGEILPEDARRRIASHALDVILRFAPGRLADGDTDLARFGVWSHALGDSERAPLFWEIQRGDPISRSGLYVDCGGQRRTAYSSLAATDEISLHRSRQFVSLKSGQFALRRLLALAEGRFDPLGCPPADPPDCRPDHSPGTATMLAFCARTSFRALRNRVEHRLLADQWLVGYRRYEGSELAESPDPTSYHWLVPPRGSFYADPFPFEVEGRRYVFFESLEYEDERGVISYVALDEEGRPGPPRVALRRSYHLSYPFLFEWQGEIYMLPETESNGTVELYRAVGFPERWELDRILLEGVGALDPTLFEHGGRFWLFVAMRPGGPGLSGGSPNDELCLYHADSPLGDWIPHPANPVVSDVTRARPAGPILRVGGDAIRPGQDCSGGYGRAIALSRIEVLDELQYRETPIARIEPTWYPRGLGTHTLSRDGDLEAIDVRIRVRR